MFMPKTSKEGVEDIQRRGFRFCQKKKQIKQVASLTMRRYNENPSYEMTTQSDFMLGQEKSDVECGGVHKTKVHIVTPLCLSGAFSRALSTCFWMCASSFQSMKRNGWYWKPGGMPVTLPGRRSGEKLLVLILSESHRTHGSDRMIDSVVS